MGPWKVTLSLFTFSLNFRLVKKNGVSLNSDVIRTSSLSRGNRNSGFYWWLRFLKTGCFFQLIWKQLTKCFATREKMPRGTCQKLHVTRDSQHVTRNSQFTKLARVPRRASRKTKKVAQKSSHKRFEASVSRNFLIFWTRKNWIDLFAK